MKTVASFHLWWLTNSKTTMHTWKDINRFRKLYRTHQEFIAVPGNFHADVTSSQDELRPQLFERLIPSRLQNLHKRRQFCQNGQFWVSYLSLIHVEGLGERMFTIPNNWRAFPEFVRLLLSFSFSEKLALKIQNSPPRWLKAQRLIALKKASSLESHKIF